MVIFSAFAMRMKGGGVCYHNRVSTTRYRFFASLPHTASTSGTDCVGLAIIVPLRGTARSTRPLWRCVASLRSLALWRGVASLRSPFVAVGGIAALACIVAWGDIAALACLVAVVDSGFGFRWQFWADASIILF